ncbi:DUF6809 family protein [Oscillibacter sp.]|uniref:DUF6809 family protein n=1 Tax=Oscillibacter sp. TaxID=1945593 RepID=UPI00261723B3|nr:DUF6809 family protein [Oscillibacter sp.]MDD3346453.1 hypothetical protein [Oscillibacter sp.]
MDYQFIREFYYGNLTLNDRDMPRNSDLGKACNAFCEAETTLTEALTGAENDALTALLTAHSEIVGISERDGFCSGFRLGALAMLDILSGTE